MSIMQPLKYWFSNSIGANELTGMILGFELVVLPCSSTSASFGKNVKTKGRLRDDVDINSDGHLVPPACQSRVDLQSRTKARHNNNQMGTCV
mmetsp:Transcript_49716/g.139166  ORF Transcript_49716/g.139166 Transcript_49716/m.139166 type:complete len:92 (+) Transcript_49716:283-558(+)